MKNKGLIITLIVLLSVACISLICLMTFMIKGNNKNFNFNFKSDRVIKEKVIDKTYEEEINKIDINSEAGDIIVKHSNSDKIRVVVYGTKDLSTSEKTGSNLVVKVKNEKCNFFCINQKLSKTIIYVPENYEGKINVKENLGDINISDYEKAEVKIDNDYGDIKLGNVSVINIKDDYGDIEIKKVNKSLNIKNDCGDIEIDEVNITEDSYIKDDYGDIEIGKTNEIYIDAKTSLGDVDINNNYKKSNITLKIRDDFGDIEVDN